MIIVCSIFGMNSLISNSAYATGEADESASSCDPADTVFFALKPWYHGLMDKDGNCNIVNPVDLDGGITTFVWTIVLNILYDISIMVGYITIVMIAWGGYLYMFSRGEVGRAEKGKKTLIAAVVGLAISMLAGVIMNTISAILIQ